MAPPPNDLTERLRHAVGVDQNLVDKFIDRAGDLAISLVVAALILAVTLWAASAAANLIRRLIGRLPHREHADTTLESFAGSLVRYVVIVVGLIAVLQQLGMQMTSILALFGAASLAVGLALQGALSNIAAGVMLLLFRPYRVGDFVEVAGRQGKVEALDLFATELATADNVKVMVPNGKVFGDVITNFSAHGKRRVDAVFKLDMKAGVPAILAGLKARAQSDPRVLPDPAPLVEVVNLSELWVEAAVRAWVAREDYAAVKADLLLAARLLTEGAELPPPALSKAVKAVAKPKRRIGILKG